MLKSGYNSVLLEKGLLNFTFDVINIFSGRYFILLMQ